MKKRTTAGLNLRVNHEKAIQRRYEKINELGHTSKLSHIVWRAEDLQLKALLTFSQLLEGHQIMAESI